MPNLEASLSREITCLSLETAGDETLKKQIYGYHRLPIEWQFSFHVGRWLSQTEPSVLRFKDNYLISQRLLQEIYFYYNERFKQVGSLEFHKIRIGLRGSTTNSYDRDYHTVFVTGKGRHSVVDSSITNFTTEFWSNDPMNKIIAGLIDLAVKGLPE